jgi:hypothetical protein
VTTPERLPDDGQQLIVFEQTIAVAHPGFVQSGKIFGKERLE